MARGEPKAVDHAQRHLFARRHAGERNAAEIGALFRRNGGHQNFADLGAHGGLMREHVGAAVQREVGAQRLEYQPLRLESMHGACSTDEARQLHRMGAKIGARFDDRLAVLDDLAEQLQFARRELPIFAQRAADVLIAAMKDEQAVTAHRDVVKAAVGKGGCHRSLSLVPRGNR